MSDLIDELLNSAGQNDFLGQITKKGAYGTVKYELDVDKSLSKILHKAQGHYLTLKVHKNFLWSHKIRRYISNLLRHVVCNFLKKYDLSAPDVLVVGLGNGSMICDSLGKLVCHKLCVVDRQMSKRIGIGHVSYLLPGVEGVTGVNSFDLVLASINKLKPNFVIVVDSLTATDINRLGLTFQFSDAGISPGGGVGNGKNVLSFNTLGVPVLSVGVPLLISIEDLCVRGCGGIYKHFTPKEIDWVIVRCADIISDAINFAIYPANIIDVYK